MQEIKAVYHAHPDFKTELVQELKGQRLQELGDLLLSSEPPINSVWAQNIWLEPQIVPITSIKNGAEVLKALKRDWASASASFHRRVHLIEENLPKKRQFPLSFPPQFPLKSHGSFALLDQNTLLLSAKCSEPAPCGTYQFIENKEDPPSRAYLKLWEALTRLQKVPRPGDKCLDVGAAPGSWTWVLANLGADVLACDRAPLAEHIAALPNVTSTQGNAFAITPSNTPPLDWIFSDLICYPEKLYDWIMLWMDSGKCKNFVCTVKLQGDHISAAVAKFKAIPGSTLHHLFNNKHELTWVFAPE